MPLNLTFTNSTNSVLKLTRCSTIFAQSTDVNQTLAAELSPLQSASFVSSDSFNLGIVHSAQEVIVEWTEPSTKTVFGFRVDFPMGFLWFHDTYSWGYYVNPAPQGLSNDWIIHSSDKLDEGLSQSIIVHNINSKFKYVIYPTLTQDLMLFNVSMGVEPPTPK